MKELKKYIAKKLLIALLLTILLPLGIFMIIYGAINGKGVMLGFGIAFTVIGFYGCPIAWIHYSSKVRLRTVLRLIEQENFYSSEQIAAHLSLKEADVVRDINDLILCGFLKGYVFKDGVLRLNTFKKQTEKDVLKRPCPNCGGLAAYNGIDFVCPYCGSVFYLNSNGAPIKKKTTKDENKPTETRDENIKKQPINICLIFYVLAAFTAYVLRKHDNLLNRLIACDRNFDEGLIVCDRIFRGGLTDHKIGFNNALTIIIKILIAQANN